MQYRALLIILTSASTVFASVKFDFGHELGINSTSTIPQETLLSIIAGVEKGNAGTELH